MLHESKALNMGIAELEPRQPTTGIFAVCNKWQNTAKNSFAVCVRQIKHGKEFNTVRMMKTHGKDIQHDRHLKKNMTKNYTQQKNKVEHDEANIHGKESRHVAVTSECLCRVYDLEYMAKNEGHVDAPIFAGAGIFPAFALPCT
jgi:hypothetical protein